MLPGAGSARVHPIRHPVATAAGKGWPAAMWRHRVHVGRVRPGPCLPRQPHGHLVPGGAAVCGQRAARPRLVDAALGLPVHRGARVLNGSTPGPRSSGFIGRRCSGSRVFAGPPDKAEVVRRAGGGGTQDAAVRVQRLVSVFAYAPCRHQCRTGNAVMTSEAETRTRWLSLALTCHGDGDGHSVAMPAHPTAITGLRVRPVWPMVVMQRHASRGLRKPAPPVEGRRPALSTNFSHPAWASRERVTRPVAKQGGRDQSSPVLNRSTPVTGPRSGACAAWPRPQNACGNHYRVASVERFNTRTASGQRSRTGSWEC